MVELLVQDGIDHLNYESLQTLAEIDVCSVAYIFLVSWPSRVISVVFILSIS